jgi:hypothetical protein
MIKRMRLFFAIILSGSEINSLQDFLNLRLWYHFRPMFCFLRLWFGAIVRLFRSRQDLLVRTSHFVSSSVCSSVETGGPNWPS